MERLTEKRTVQPSCDINGELESKEYIYIKDKGLAEKKLFELEDIEEDLGIDLVILLKALKQGYIWFRRKDGIIVSRSVRYIGEFGLTYTGDSLGNCGDYPDSYNYYPYSDYGKTWAFTREELENE